MSSIHVRIVPKMKGGMSFCGLSFLVAATEQSSFDIEDCVV